ncbi:MAG TPA: DUF393 domain-containing protein [Blastocatellia bacterium]|nr:DUF393 domain-containing protein [Blastocatellia bacterium]HMV82722.1 DUF393 domain-containing protein [Blastocatellia bacterium]HMZ16973.1 DUF393 domain-containing protein [Blastocatellia bacterium]HNG30389.1 DUF393 domain-containing protein [Blastocatellia bacterium]
MLTVQANQDYVLFDGDCGVCSWACEIAKRMDGGRQFVIEPYQMFAERELLRFGISYEQCTKKLQVVTRRERVHQGALGVNYFLWKQFPWTLLVVLIYALPVLLVLELIGYRLVAQNRHRISAWLGLTACKLRQE